MKEISAVCAWKASIDNDHSLGAAVGQTIEWGSLWNRHQAEIRAHTCVFCLDEMDQPLPEKVKKHFEYLNPDLFLQRWIEKLYREDQYQKSLMDKGEAQQLFLDKGSYIGVPLTISVLDRLYRKLKTIKEELARDSNVTHQQLLEKLEPSLVKRYNFSLRQESNFMERFRKSDGRYVSSVTSEAYLKAWEEPFANQQEALKALERIRQSYTQKVLGQEYTDFSQLESLESQQRFIAGLKFSSMNLSKESEWIKKLGQHYSLKEWWTLKLVGTKLLKGPQILSWPLGNLVYLDLSHSSKITGEDLANLSEVVPVLRVLKANNLPNLTQFARYKKLSWEYSPMLDSITFLMLKKLDVSHNQNLTLIHLVAPSLENLYVEQCPQLSFSGWRGSSLEIGKAHLQKVKAKGLGRSPKAATYFEKTHNLNLYKDFLLASEEIQTTLMQLTEKETESLFLEHISLQKSEVKILAKALKINRTLTELSLLRNQLEAEELEGLLQGLINSSTLRSLSIEKNKIGDKGAQVISYLVKNNTHLKSVVLIKNEIQVEGVRSLAQALLVNPQLIWLNLYKNRIQDEGAQALAEILPFNTSLKFLYLSDNKIGSLGVKTLTKALETNTTLTALYLNNNRIGLEGAKGLAKALLANTSLIRLTLQDTGIGDIEAELIGTALSQNIALELIDFRLNKIKLMGAKAIANALRTNTTLRMLALGDNLLKDEGIQVIAEALSSNTTLKVLDLEENQLKEQGLEALAKALVSNKSLSVLEVARNHIGNKGIKRFATMLPFNTGLTVLGLAENNISRKAVKILAEALLNNHTLTGLHLPSNDLIKGDLEFFAKTLSINQSFRILGLKYSEEDINDEEAAFINKFPNVTLVSPLDIWNSLMEEQLETDIDQLLEINNKQPIQQNKISYNVQKSRFPAFLFRDNLAETERQWWQSLSKYKESRQNFFGPINFNKPFHTLLSVQGDNPQTLRFLRKIEQALPQNVPILSLFEQIGGTSTAGICVLSLNTPNSPYPSEPISLTQMLDYFSSPNTPLTSFTELFAQPSTNQSQFLSASTQPLTLFYKQEDSQDLVIYDRDDAQMSEDKDISLEQLSESLAQSEGYDPSLRMVTKAQQDNPEQGIFLLSLGVSENSPQDHQFLNSQQSDKFLYVRPLLDIDASEEFLDKQARDIADFLIENHKLSSSQKVIPFHRLSTSASTLSLEAEEQYLSAVQHHLKQLQIECDSVLKANQSSWESLTQENQNPALKEKIESILSSYAKQLEQQQTSHLVKFVEIAQKVKDIVVGKALSSQEALQDKVKKKHHQKINQLEQANPQSFQEALVHFYEWKKLAFYDLIVSEASKAFVTYEALALGTVGRLSDNTDNLLSATGTVIGTFIPGLKTVTTGLQAGISFYKDRAIKQKAHRITNLYQHEGLEAMLRVSKDLAEAILNKMGDAIVVLSPQSLSRLAYLTLDQMLNYVIEQEQTPSLAEVMNQAFYRERMPKFDEKLDQDDISQPPLSVKELFQGNLNFQNPRSKPQFIYETVKKNADNFTKAIDKLTTIGTAVARIIPKV